MVRSSGGSFEKHLNSGMVGFATLLDVLDHML